MIDTHQGRKLACADDLARGFRTGLIGMKMRLDQLDGDVATLSQVTRIRDEMLELRDLLGHYERQVSRSADWNAEAAAVADKVRAAFVACMIFVSACLLVAGQSLWAVAFFCLMLPFASIVHDRAYRHRYVKCFEHYMSTGA